MTNKASTKPLIDECLSPELAQMAQARGYGGASHVGWLGKAGMKDWELLPLIVDGDWTFVTRNAIDFRGPKSAPGSKGQYTRTDLHAGLICLEGPSSGFDLETQLELFAVALDDLDRDPDLVNQVLEVAIDDDDHLIVRRYALPTET